MKFLATLVLIPMLLAPPALAQEFVMKISSPAAKDSSNRWMEMFKAGVEAGSGGRIRVDLFPASQLGSIPTTVEAVSTGTIEMTIPAAGFLTGLDPRFQVLDVPGLFKSVQHGHDVLADPEVRSLIATFGADRGAEALFVYIASPQYILSRSPVLSVEDFSGMRIRAVGAAPVYVETLAALGAGSVALSLADALPALQTGTIDAMISGLTPYVSFGYYDVATELTELPGSYLVTVGLVSKDFLARVGPELEAVLREEARKAERAFRDIKGSDLDGAMAEWISHGGVEHQLDGEAADRYLDVVRNVADGIVAKDPALAEAYAVLASASARVED